MRGAELTRGGRDVVFSPSQLSPRLVDQWLANSEAAGGGYGLGCQAVRRLEITEAQMRLRARCVVLRRKDDSACAQFPPRLLEGRTRLFVLPKEEVCASEEKQRERYVPVGSVTSGGF